MMASFVCMFILSVYRCKLSVSKQPKTDSAEFVFLLSTLQRVAFLLKAKKKSKQLHHIFITVTEKLPNNTS